MKDLVEAKVFLKNVLPGMQLVIAVTLAKITLKKPYLLFRKMSTPEKHEKLL